MRFSSIFSAVSLAVLAPVPAGAQDAGTRMAAEAERAGDRADDKAHLADQWRDGEKMIAEGNRLISRSERRVAHYSRDASRYQAHADRATADGAKAHASLAEGQRLIEAGGRLKAQAETRFPLVPSA